MDQVTKLTFEVGGGDNENYSADELNSPKIFLNQDESKFSTSQKLITPNMNPDQVYKSLLLKVNYFLRTVLRDSLQVWPSLFYYMHHYADWEIKAIIWNLSRADFP